MKTATGKKAKNNTGWRELANLVSEVKLRTFVLDYATGNKEFRSRLESYFSDYDKTESLVKYREMITKRLDAVSDRHGYIDHDHASVAMSPVYDLLYKADRYIEKASLKDGWSKEYRTKKYLQYKARLFQKEGKDTEAKKIIDDNLYISDFREMRVNEYLDERNFNEAIRLVNEGAKIATDGKYAGTEQMWKVKLLEIYERLGHVEDIRKTAEGLFFGHNHEIRFYRKLKETFPYAEWSTERENIIKKLIQEKKGQAQVKWYFNQSLAEIYIEEELWDRLFGLVQQNPQIHILTGYGKYLNENYSDELTGFYQTAISAFADANTGRPAYQKLVQYLNEMARLKQGQAAVQKLKSELLARYKNRPAMKEELDKL